MSRVWYRLDFGSDLKPEAVLQFVRSLSARQRHGWLVTADPVVFEVRSVCGRLTWRLGVSRREHDQVLGNLRLALPDVRTEIDEADRPVVERVWEVRTSSARRPLRTDTPRESTAALLAALRLTRKSETLILQWLVGPWLHRPIPTTAPHHRADGLTDVGVLVLTSEQTRALRQKHSEPVFGVVGRIGIAAAAGRAAVLRQRLIGALQLVRAPGAGLERRLLPSFVARRHYLSLHQPLFTWPCVLSASELTSCLGWPAGNPPIEGVTYSGHRQLPPPTDALVQDENDRVTGKATYPGREGYLHQRVEAAMSHTWMIGGTGAGKSTLMARLAVTDIRAGRGVVVVDPSAKGDLIRDVADRIPTNRVDDVVLLDAGDDHPVGLNVLAGDPDTATDAIVHILHELYAGYLGPRSGDLLYHATLTLARYGGMTLCELPALLTNADFRRRVVARLRGDHLGVAPFWSAFDSLSETERPTVVAPLLNKIRPFTQRPAIRGIIGQANGFDVAEIFTKRKVLLVSLATGQIGSQTAQLLGSLTVATVWRAIEARGALPPERRQPVLVYLDEFQNLLRLPLDIGDALVQARGLGVGLVLANQHVGQLTPAVRAAVGSNSRSTIAFGLAHEDAKTLAKHLDNGLTAVDVQNLARFESYQAIYTGRGQTTTASAVTLPLPPALGSLDAVRARSRAAYGKGRAQVDAELLARRSIGSHEGDAPIGTRRRGGRS